MRISGGEQLAGHLELLIDLLEVYVGPAHGLAVGRVLRVGRGLVGLGLEQDWLGLVAHGAGQIRLVV